MKHYYRLFLLAALLLLPTFVRLHADDILVNGTSRNMITYIPNELGCKRPLLISMHGMSQDANYQKNMLKIETVADTAKFAVVFPNGISNAWDISGDRDLNFVLAIIDTMAARYDIDRNRVYLSGFSMGGMFTYYAMNHLADKIAAFAPISGYPLGGASFTSSRSVPIIHTHGTSDDVVVYSGVASVLSGWVQRNHCLSTAVKTPSYTSPVCTRYCWGGGDDGVEVVLLEMANKGHWISNDGMLTGNEIWKFCSRYALDLHNPVVQMVSPVSGTRFTTLGGPASAVEAVVEATAYDPDGSVQSVAFYDGDSLLCTLDHAPYRHVWTGVPVGLHRLRAVVTDDEGRTGETSGELQVNAPEGSVSLSDEFTAAGTIPAGWITTDGAETRVGYQAGLTSGCRLIQFTGATHDFDYGMYIRNTTGEAGAGSLSYAAASSVATLTLYPGTYKLVFKVANWNMSAFGDVSVGISSRSDATASPVAATTVHPTVNMGNSSDKSFSGGTVRSFFFTITEPDDYAIAFRTVSQQWADAIVSQVTLMIPNDVLAPQKALLAAAIFAAEDALSQCADVIYRGEAYDALTACVADYTSWAATSVADYDAAVAALHAATQALLDHKAAVDATEQIIEVFNSRFSEEGAARLPKGWTTFDGTTLRVGPLSDLYQGARILQFTGTPRSFDHALYIRNINGNASEGYALYGGDGCDTVLALSTGRYTLKYTLCNWNMSSFGAITTKVFNRATGAELFAKTITPTANVGNNAANAFSGATTVSQILDVTEAGNYVLAFYTADAGWADALIADVSLSRSEHTAVGIDAVTDKACAVAAVIYYNLNGVRVSHPVSGCYLRRILYVDGTSRTTRVLLQD